LAHRARTASRPGSQRTRTHHNIPSAHPITGLFLAKFHLLPVGQRILIRIVQQLNRWRDLPKTISARIPAQ